ncbi:MAG: serine/threonine protein kinase, partial [Persicimonas sp.]
MGDLLVDRYRIEDVVGSGAFGAIFSAIDQHSGERVAVKALPPETEQVSATALARFRREMKVISNLVHRHIVGLYDFGQTHDEVFFMILEYVDGLPLDRAVRGRPMEPQDALDVGEQIASALQLAHHSGVVHRDLKPANIMISGQPGAYVAKVLDFGMAKLLTRIDDESIAQLTREGMAVGTPRYIAPEQARGEQVGPWTDLYALGLLMYEMFTGARAVKADDVEGAVSAHVSREPLELEELDQIPEVFRPLIFGLIEKNPQRRFRDADTVLAEIDSLRYHSGDAGPVFDPRRGRVTHPHSNSAANSNSGPTN